MIERRKKGFKAPSQKDLESIDEDKPFRQFLRKVIICTEMGYDEAALDGIKEKPVELKFKSKYLEMLNSVVHELLTEKRMQHL